MKPIKAFAVTNNNYILEVFMFKQTAEIYKASLMGKLKIIPVLITPIKK